MTTRKTAKPAAVVAAEQAASIPKRQVIQHTAILRAELKAALIKANNALLSAAADSRDAEIALANQRYDAIRMEVDADRNDILLTIEGIEAALERINTPSNVVKMAAE